MTKRSEKCYEAAFYVVAWPPLVVVDILIGRKPPAAGGFALLGVVGLMWLPIAAPIASVLVIAGKIASLFADEEEDQSSL